MFVNLRCGYAWFGVMLTSLSSIGMLYIWCIRSWLTGPQNLHIDLYTL